MKNLYNIKNLNFNGNNSIKDIIKSSNVPLSYRERKVLEYAARGLDNPAIAQKLYISRHTVKAHLAAAFRKLSAINRTNAVYIALKSKIID